jgi:hypothetical protein
MFETFKLSRPPCLSYITHHRLRIVRLDRPRGNDAENRGEKHRRDQFCASQKHKLPVRWNDDKGDEFGKRAHSEPRGDDAKGEILV